ncbi:MAG: organic hydroperoxide resistance protein [Marinifilaceae bacterium]|jgi:Ohr subfamily peroxiredoxin|nr:organic hydroperoxide resistance protein [Marinifilaceae bacterium]
MDTSKLYSTEVRVEGGRNGKATSNDGVLNLELRMPKELGGTGGEYTNPEQLFAAGFAACFDGALNLMAKQRKMMLKNTAIDASVELVKVEDGLKLGVKLTVEIPEVEESLAKELLKEAHEFCPYSRATRGNIDVVVELAK